MTMKPHLHAFEATVIVSTTKPYMDDSYNSVSVVRMRKHAQETNEL